MATWIQSLQGVSGVGNGDYERGLRLVVNHLRGELWAAWSGNSNMMLAGSSTPVNPGQPQIARYKVDLSGEDSFYSVEFASPVRVPTPNTDIARTALVDCAMNDRGDLCMIVAEQHTESGFNNAGYWLNAMIRDGTTGLWGRPVYLRYLGSPDQDGTDPVEDESYELEWRGMAVVTTRVGDFIVVAGDGSTIYQWRYLRVHGQWLGPEVLVLGIVGQFKHTKIAAEVDTGNRLTIIFDEFAAAPSVDEAIRRVRFMPGGSITVDEDEIVIAAEDPYGAGTYWPKWPAFVTDPLDPERIDLVYAWRNGSNDIARIISRRNSEWGTPQDLMTPGAGTHTPRTDPAIAIDDRRVRHLVYCVKAPLGLRKVAYRSLSEDGNLSAQEIVSTTIGLDLATDPVRHPGAEFLSVAYHSRYSELIIAWDEQTSTGSIPAHGMRFAYSRDAISGDRVDAPQFQVDCFTVGCASNADSAAEIELQDFSVTADVGVRRTPWWRD